MMIEILTWTSIFAGGILVLLLLLSLLGGLDMDIDIGDTEVDADSGGLGLIKGFLTFVSVGSWVIKVLLATNKSPVIAISIGIISGLFALWILNYLLRLLMKNESNVNWKMEDALFQKGEVYLRVPAEEGNGIVHVRVNGVNRELKALSYDSKEIKTGSPITVMDIDGEFVKVQLLEN